MRRSRERFLVSPLFLSDLNFEIFIISHDFSGTEPFVIAPSDIGFRSLLAEHHGDEREENTRSFRETSAILRNELTKVWSEFAENAGVPEQIEIGVKG